MSYWLQARISPAIISTDSVYTLGLTLVHEIPTVMLKQLVTVLTKTSVQIGIMVVM